MSAPSNTLAEAVGRIHEQARGLLAVHVIRRDDMPHMIAAAISGDAEAAQLLVEVNTMLARIIAAPADAPMECGCCGTALAGGRFAFVIASADTANPEAGVGMAICRRCGTTLGAIKAAALKALRGFWPDGRFIEVTHSDGGRA